ncbi:hypothetical protein C8F04DRAFT_1183806 [Mycena alexandri]|uniref:CxC2-like cysteine cluster KDZ transposase-associated domain-containing protein n=1 Tax=Mycena alexandri TaxID=1745969 RepID=A0AAD6STM7_9AGAR|nr:hypothetical protein C8F04DRAFT_1183806 [Mycena alexandri]
MFRQRGGNGKGNKRSAAAADAQLKKRVKVHSTADPNEIVHHSISSGGTVSTTTTYQRPEDVTIIKKLPEPALPSSQKQPAPTQNLTSAQDSKNSRRFQEAGTLSTAGNHPTRGQQALRYPLCLRARTSHLRGGVPRLYGIPTVVPVLLRRATLQQPFPLGRNLEYGERIFGEARYIASAGGTSGFVRALWSRVRQAKAEEHKMLFTIVDNNRIDGTSVRICRCGSAGVDRCQQLLDAHIFPCTLDGPCRGITFNCMKKFQLLSLESKITAYDYVGSLSRITDNSFTETVPDLYENFMCCAHIWGVLTLKKRVGQEHGIDEFIPLRPKGNLVLYCPSCPEPGFNSHIGTLNLRAVALIQIAPAGRTPSGKIHKTEPVAVEIRKGILLA